MDYASATDPAFLGKLESWLGAQPEILVLIRYSLAAGSKGFEFFSSFDDLATRIHQLPPSTSIIAFKQPQLQLRGVVNDDFIANCLSRVPNGSEFLVLETALLTPENKSRLHWAGETHSELREVLESARGALVAFGPYPPCLRDTDDVVSAIVPDENGFVRLGVY
jgi:hypothetical protein